MANRSSGSDEAWHIWTAIECLEQSERRLPHQYALSDAVLMILKLWATTWADPARGSPVTGTHSDGVSEDFSWIPSLLNKRTLFHEIEESMVALYYLDRWKRNTTVKHFVAVDVCGGKGIFSMLLAYYNALFWKNDGKSAKLERIILIEKSTSRNINWGHLKATPPSLETSEDCHLVPIVIWENCNLHDFPALLDRFTSPELRELPLALTGVHLCKMLSPSMISLANLLGCDRCPYICLAPCCMPRAVRSRNSTDHFREGKHGDATTPIIQILSYEDPNSRQKRLHAIRMKQSKRKKHLGACFLCQATDHWFLDCPTTRDQSASHLNNLDSKHAEEQRRAAFALAPCWRCGDVGHFKADCPRYNDSSNTIGAECNRDLTLDPPIAKRVDVSNVLQSPYPLMEYCSLLVPAFENRSIEIIDADLRNGDKHVASNWNSRRKSLFMVTSDEARISWQWNTSDERDP